jgi:hypothetical protein
MIVPPAKLSRSTIRVVQSAISYELCRNGRNLLLLALEDDCLSRSLVSLAVSGVGGADMSIPVRSISLALPCLTFVIVDFCSCYVDITFPPPNSAGLAGEVHLVDATRVRGEGAVRP